MPNNNKTGPVGNGPRNGIGRKTGGRGQRSTRKGQGAMTGGRKGLRKNAK